MSGSDRPCLVFADRNGRIYDFPEVEMVGAHAGRWKRLEPDDWIPLPEGSELFVMPDRLPVGYSTEHNSFVVLDRNPYTSEKPVYAVSAFVAPAHTVTYSAAYKTQKHAGILPLFSYAAVGWYKDRFVTAALRVDPDIRQDIKYFDLNKVSVNAKKFIRKYRNNRLVQHLGRCALSYACPAARNFFLKRWEAPLPTSPACNARCLGCISYQDNPHICANQDRIGFVPTPEEIAEVAVSHIRIAEKPVVSFGQGCEGEPLLQADTLGKAIRIIREEVNYGTINVNSNASLPDRVLHLIKSGLDSIRVSINSFQEKYYMAYYRPVNYTLEDVKKSIRLAKSEGIFVSLNYLILPGFTDDPKELRALIEFLKECSVDLIQMRNLNIDPEWYLDSISFVPTGPPTGIVQWMDLIKNEFPEIRFGYFNPHLR